MEHQEFEKILNETVLRLTAEARVTTFSQSKVFENRVRQILQDEVSNQQIAINFEPHPYGFPDIAMGEYGVEVKFTTNDTWRSVANSVFEGLRVKGVNHIYVIFGKMGGIPEVKWGKYEDCVMHVRTSHVPRFEVEIGAKQSLFNKMGITYEEFKEADPEEKMKYVRKYARGRLKEGERLWWLEDEFDQQHTLPMQAQLYIHLDQQEKRKLRAEAALLCPQIVKSSRSKNKYDDVVLYILTYHGVLCSQARDLFSAGSVALRADGTRGGNYILRALKDIENEMQAAAQRLDDKLFIEYWGESCAPNKRISKWLQKADGYADNWTPSKELFQQD